jgi:hypothetical protein
MQTLSNLQLVSEFNFCGHRAKGLVSVLLPLIREFQCVSYGNVYLHALHTYLHCIAAISNPLLDTNVARSGHSTAPLGLSFQPAPSIAHHKVPEQAPRKGNK